MILIGKGSIINAQQDTLASSIGYITTLMNSGTGEILYSDNYDGYPEDLTQSKIFFIEVSQEETKGNTGVLGPKTKKINSTIATKINKKNIPLFEIYPNEYRAKGIDFFISKGFQYRLLIQSEWDEITKEIYDRETGEYIGPSTEWKQRFRFVIEDLDNGYKYSIDTLTAPLRKAVELFLAKIN